jgi:hypothetical protein
MVERGGSLVFIGLLVALGAAQRDRRRPRLRRLESRRHPRQPRVPRRLRPYRSATSASPCTESQLSTRYKTKPTPAGANLGRGLALTLPPQTAALVEIVERTAKGKLLISKSEGPRLDVRGVTFRLITLRPDEFEAYQKRYGLRVTFDVSVTMKDDRHALVSVNFDWAGSEWAAERRDNTWHFIEIERWVT